MGHPAGPTTPAPENETLSEKCCNCRTNGGPKCAALLAENERLRELIRDDGYAITFQTMGQYRTALLRALRSPSTEASNE